jgi:hypothetical protein
MHLCNAQIREADIVRPRKRFTWLLPDLLIATKL